MINIAHNIHHIRSLNNFEELLSTPFYGDVNAMCWNRKLEGDFSEIIKKVELDTNIKTLSVEELLELQLSEQGELARKTLLNDLKILEAHGADPILNIIKNYDRDEDYPFFPTDVYSFHVDRSPIATDTFLCTYYGESSEIVANNQAEQKILIPEIRAELKKLCDEADFEAFLSDYFFDLHYQAKPHAQIIKLGIGHLWKISTDHPNNQVLPCIHRAPKEKTGESRLLLIC